MTCQRFVGSARPTLGVELELQTVDAGTLALRDAAGELLRAAPEALRDRVRPEFHACCVEVSTGVCGDVAEVGRDLDASLRALEGLAAGRGLRLAWGGTHPFSHWRAQGVTDRPRYRELADEFRETLCRQLTFGLHVHVGVPDGDAAARACTRVRDHLPALLALSANSPFWCGRATGLLSHRVEVLSTAPTSGMPPALGSWGEYNAVVGCLMRHGVIQSLKDLWWDVRPSPGNGTVEVRVCDMPADLDAVLAVAAVCQCLVHDAAAPAAGCDSSSATCRDLVLRQNRWRAARHGLDAALVDLDTAETTTARQALRTLCDRLSPVAADLGCADELAAARALAAAPTAAERLLAVYARTGNLAAVVRRTVNAPARSRAAENPAYGLPRIGPLSGGVGWGAAPGAPLGN